MDNVTIAHSYANLGRWPEAIFHAMADSNALLSLCSNPNVNDQVLNQLMNCIDAFVEPTNLINALAENIPMDVSQDSIQRLYQYMVKYHDKSAAYLLVQRLDHTTSKEKTTQDFFHAMESFPDLHCFATIKSYYTGSYEPIKNNVGNFSVPDLMVSSGIEAYAKKAQALILKDSKLNVFSHKDSKYITLYRGFSGQYAESITKFMKDNDQSNPEFQFDIPTLFASNWTVNRETAVAQAKRVIANQVSDSGIIVTLDIDVKSILHSTFHNPLLTSNSLNMSAAPTFIVGHPSGTLCVRSMDVDQADSAGWNSTAMNYIMAKSEDILEKNAFKKILPLATAFALAGSPTNVSNIENHFGSAHRSLITEKEDAPKADINDNMLANIKHVESSNGRNVNHPLVTGGLNAGTKAIGNYAIMPLQIKEIASKDPNLKVHAKVLNQFDHVKDQDKIAQYIQDNKLEDKLASSHLKRIQAKFPNDVNRQVYAWNQGITGALKSSKEKIDNHDYVKKYHKYDAMRSLAGK